MSLALQMHLVMMSKYTNLVLISLTLIEQWATLKYLLDVNNINHNNIDHLAITIAQLFLQSWWANEGNATSTGKMLDSLPKEGAVAELFSSELSSLLCESSTNNNFVYSL